MIKFLRMKRSVKIKLTLVRDECYQLDSQSPHHSTITYLFPFSSMLLHIYLPCICFTQDCILATTDTHNNM